LPVIQHLLRGLAAGQGKEVAAFQLLGRAPILSTTGLQAEAL